MVDIKNEWHRNMKLKKRYPDSLKIKKSLVRWLHSVEMKLYYITNYWDVRSVKEIYGGAGYEKMSEMWEKIWFRL